MQPRWMHWREILGVTAGALLTILGATLVICWEDIFNDLILDKALTLSPTSRSFPIWRKPDIPLFFDFYFFNWTNPEEFLNVSAKPKFSEVGPYRFREIKEKVNITFNPENGTVSYQQLRRWYFDLHGTEGSLDDEITSLNVVAASAVYSSRSWSFLRQKGVSIGLDMFHQTLHVTKTVRQLLFDGYEDPLLDLANSLPMETTGGIPPVDKFGWFYKRNNTYKHDGYFNIATGMEPLSSGSKRNRVYQNTTMRQRKMREVNFQADHHFGRKFVGQVMHWNHKSRTPFYEGTCNMINGSAGEFFPQHMKSSDKLTLFSADLCRSIKFDFDEHVSVKGIRALRYVGGHSIIDNGTKFEENRCFCPGDCQPSGLLNVSACRFGSPAFISFPHFHLADPYYLDAVEGLKPQPEKHTFFMTVEPTTGIPIDVGARFQLNILVAPNENIGLYRKVRKIYFPVLWFEQKVQLDNDMAYSLKVLLLVPLIGTVTAIVILIIGIIILIWNSVRLYAIARLQRSCRRETQNCPAQQGLNNRFLCSAEKINILPSTKAMNLKRCNADSDVTKELV